MCDSILCQVAQVNNSENLKWLCFEWWVTFSEGYTHCQFPFISVFTKSFLNAGSQEETNKQTRKGILICLLKYFWILCEILLQVTPNSDDKSSDIWMCKNNCLMFSCIQCLALLRRHKDKNLKDKKYRVYS